MQKKKTYLRFTLLENQALTAATDRSGNKRNEKSIQAWSMVSETT